MSQVINSCLVGLNNVGRAFWGYAAGMFVQAGVLIVLLLIIDFLLLRRVRAALRYCLWMLVFVKLVLPPTLSLPTGVGYWCGEVLGPEQIFPQIGLSLNHTEDAPPVIAEGLSTANLSAYLSSGAPMPVETADPAASAVSSFEPITWQAAVFVFWLVGVLVLSALFIQRVLFVRSLIAQSKPAGGQLLDMLRQSCRQIGIHRDVKLRLSSNTSSPAVCGLFRPTILLASALSEYLTPDKLRTVLIHELAHIKRGDLWVNSVQAFLQVIYFYNPFVWLANIIVRRIREQAVDEMVLVALGAEAKSYSNTLIDIAEMAFWKANLSLRLIGVVESKKALQRRIKHMLTRPIPKTAKLGFAGLLATIITGAVLLPMAKADKNEESAVEASTPKESQCIARLPSGMMVELVGLFTGQSKEELTWWRPGGTIMSEQEYAAYEDKIDPTHIRHLDSWQFEYGYVLRFTPSDDVSTMADVTVGDNMVHMFPRKQGVSVNIVESDEYQREKGLPQTGDIMVAAAHGPMKSFTSEYRVDLDGDTFALDDGSTIMLSPVRPDRYEPDRGLMIDTTVNASDVDIKVFYESKGGDIRNAWADGTRGGPSLLSPHRRPKTMIQETFTLHSIAKEDLKKIIVEYRRFEGVAFNNVALKPGIQTIVTAEILKGQEKVTAGTGIGEDASAAAQEIMSARPKQPITVQNAQPMNPQFTADLDNGTSVELLGLTKFNGGDLKWWSPDGSPTDLASVTARDMKRNGNIVAFRFYGRVGSFAGYYMIASAMHEIKEKWQAGSEGVWLGVLGYPEERDFGKLYFSSKGKPGQTLFTIPLTADDIGRRRAINRYGVNRIQGFERIGFDGFAIEILHDDKLDGDEFAAVDRSGKMREYVDGYSTKNRSYMKYKFPAEDLAAIVRQKYSYSAAKFVNVSLQGKKAKVLLEREQTGVPEQPRVSLDSKPKFMATMPNGVKVGLVALGRLVDGSLQWWTPEAEPTSIPEVLECDVEGYDVVLAYKLQGSNGFTSYSMQNDGLHRIKEDWYVQSHQLWMAPLDKAAYARTADFAVRAQGGQWETRLEIPLSEKEIGQEIEINKLGYEKVAEFTELTPNSFRVRITYSSKRRALGEFAVEDKEGKIHEGTSRTVWRSQSEMIFPIPAEQLSKLVVRKQQIGQATFRNISLQPGQRTKVQIETQQVGYLIPPSQAKWVVEDVDDETTDVQAEVQKR